MMLGFSLPLQMALLEEALDLDEAVSSLEMLYAMWKQGDEQGITELSMTGGEEIPAELAIEYYDAMIATRNLLMADAAERYMAEGRTVFYVVGLAHMIGEDGIVSLLRQRGYSVERVPV